MSDIDQKKRCPVCSEEVLPWDTKCASCGTDLSVENLKSDDSPEEGTPAASTSTEDSSSVAQNETSQKVASGTRRLTLVSSRRFWKLGGIVVAVSLIVVGIGWGAFWKPQRPAELLYSFKLPNQTFTTILFTTDGKQVAAGTTSGDVIYWDLATQKPTILSNQSRNPVITLAFAPGEVLAAADETGNVFGWEANGSRELNTTQLKFPATAINFRQSRKAKQEIILCTSNSDVLFINPKKNEKYKSQHKFGIKTAVYLPKRDLLVTSGSDGQVAWMDVESRETLKIAKAHRTEVDALAVSPNESKLASGDWNGNIVIWDVKSRNKDFNVIQPGAVSSMAFRGNHLITGSWDGHLRFWSLEQKSIMREIDTGSAIYNFAISPDGNTIATVSAEARIDLWNVLTF